MSIMGGRSQEWWTGFTIGKACRLLAPALLVVLAFAVGVTPAAQAATSAGVIASLSAQRAANGLPGDITERSDWSSACAQHNAYMQQNNVIGHGEDPSRPGYTSEGAWAGQNSVLAYGSTFDTGNPFELAPIHLDQLLAPRLNAIGADERGGYVCVTTWPGYLRSPVGTPVIQTYPGDGRTGVPGSETARESPFTPGDFVGLPQGTTTGPHLYVFVDGPWQEAFTSARITGASLAGPAGPVEVRWVDRSTGQIGPYLATGGIVIPVQPLQASATYTASVSVEVAGSTTSRTWRFTTAAAARPPDPPPGGTNGNAGSGNQPPGGNNGNGGTGGDTTLVEFPGETPACVRAGAQVSRWTRAVSAKRQKLARARSARARRAARKSLGAARQRLESARAAKRRNC